MALIDDLDRRAVVTAAAVPAVLLIALRLLGAPEEALALAILVAYPACGVVATVQAPARPIVHAAVAAALAAALTIAVTVIRRAMGDGFSASAVVSLLLYVQIALAASVLGSLITSRVRTYGGAP